MHSIAGPKATNLPELELEALVSHPPWVLRAELGCSPLEEQYTCCQFFSVPALSGLKEQRYMMQIMLHHEMHGQHGEEVCQGADSPTKQTESFLHYSNKSVTKSPLGNNPAFMSHASPLGHELQAGKGPSPFSAEAQCSG